MEVNDHTLDETTGRLIMKYRGLTGLDINILKSIDLAHIVHLDISYNNLQHLPIEIELLSNLEYLNCSWNRLESLPPVIGTFQSFRTLNAAKNRITQVPKEIGQCFWLKYLDLSENKLNELPESLCNCSRLRVIYLQNNQLIKLPCSLALLRSHGILEEMNVTGNPQLDIIPEPVQSQADAILWILSLFYENQTQLEYILRKTNEYHILFDAQERRLLLEKEHYAQLLEYKDKLLVERKSVKWFLTVLDWKRKYTNILRTMISEMNMLFSLKTSLRGLSRTKIDPAF